MISGWLTAFCPKVGILLAATGLTAPIFLSASPKLF
jgi:hypothetical protein